MKLGPLQPQQQQQQQQQQQFQQLQHHKERQWGGYKEPSANPQQTLYSSKLAKFTQILFALNHDILVYKLTSLHELCHRAPKPA